MRNINLILLMLVLAGCGGNQIELSEEQAKKIDQFYGFDRAVERPCGIYAIQHKGTPGNSVAGMIGWCLHGKTKRQFSKDASICDKRSDHLEKHSLTRHQFYTKCMERLGYERRLTLKDSDSKKE